MKGRPLLVVDDDADLREAITDVLRDAGYEVIVASNGRNALDVLARSNPLPGLVLLDMMMPVLDGAGFLAEVRNHPEWADVPVVVFSASAHPNLQEDGARGWVRKPVDLDALLEVVAQHVVK
ncbi:response regulator [Hyalangium versicolor]|uniref:response regulator n=1 Tax=Hyalangium versicolor TaxID=2861190 RepID=UPI001CCF2F74|nr:response regulator [Hyalangium versicolor]